MNGIAVSASAGLLINEDFNSGTYASEWTLGGNDLPTLQQLDPPSASYRAAIRATQEGVGTSTSILTRDFSVVPGSQISFDATYAMAINQAPGRAIVEMNFIDLEAYHTGDTPHCCLAKVC